MAKTLIFDFDGTIVDSAPALLATYELVLQRHGLKPRRALTRDLIGPPLHETLARVTGLSEKARLDALIADFKQVYDSDGVRATGIYDGMDQLLRELAVDYRLYLATNKRLHPTGLLLDLFDLRRCFAGVYALDSQTPPFADKATMLMGLLQQQALTAQDCVYIGDTCHDEIASGRAGIPFIGVLWGYGIGTQLVSKRATVAASTADLAKVIAAHFTESTR
ncbi:MAG TPA: HAD hydrolase-like protein [Candidatus Acidoferrum sp.]|nr:HAD hydrolase-like protein [Candidatus Acidoferrum sp.]